MKSLRYLILLAMLFGTLSCDSELEEINRNPNNPEEVNPDLLMVTILRSTINQMVNEAWNTGNIVAQYAAEIREPNTDRYIWTGALSTWSNGYTVLRDVENLYQIADERGLDNYKGIALVMRGLIFSRMTDVYGDLPYSRALRGKEDEPVYSPEYDTQEQIYAGLLEELEEANRLLSDTGGEIRSDILYGNGGYIGDPTLWRKLANSLQLRLLVRQSNRIDPSQRLREILADPATYPIFTSNEDNATLAYVESPNLFPVTATRIGFWRDRRLSKTLSDQMNATGDPRLAVYAQPTNESAETGELAWEGVRNGESDENLSSDIDAKVSTLGSIYYVDLAVPVEAEGIVMTYSEVCFILAEAAQKGWIQGSAMDYYYEGVRASVDYYAAVSGEEIVATDEFLDTPGVRFEPADALQLIGTQKWISLYFTDLQGWHEWKRTGIPTLTPSIVNNNGDRIPVRSLYPSEQQITNRTNYEAAVARQGEDDINTRLWWQ